MEDWKSSRDLVQGLAVSSSDDHVFVEGVLKKQKKGPLGGWVERWYRLTPQGLFYFKTSSRPTSSSHPVNFIDISNGKYFKAANVIKKSITSRTKEKESLPAIHIQLENRNLLLICGSVEDRGKWLRGLSRWQLTHRKDYAILPALKGAVPESKELELSQTMEIQIPVPSPNVNYDITKDMVRDFQTSLEDDIKSLEAVLRQIAQKVISKECTLSRKLKIASTTTKRVYKSVEDCYNVLLREHSILPKRETSKTRLLSTANSSRIVGDQLGRGLAVLSLSNSRRTSTDNSKFSKRNVTEFEHSDRIRSNITDVVDPKYWDLLNLLVEDNFTIALQLCQNTENAHFDRMAHALIHMFVLMNCSSDFLGAVIQESVDDTTHEGTLFRNNSVPSKMLSYYVKDHGSFYLESILSSFLSGLSRIPVSMSFEINPDKLDKPENAEVHLVLLKKYIGDLMKLLLESVDAVPIAVRKVAFHIRKCVAIKFPGAEISAVGGMFFLRFVNPAILSPFEYNLVKKVPTPEFTKNLIMLAKVLQNMSNGVLFGKKEPHMKVLNETIESFQEPLKHFLNEIARVSDEFFVSDFESVSKADCDAAKEDLDFLFDSLDTIERFASSERDHSVSRMSVSTAKESFGWGKGQINIEKDSSPKSVKTTEHRPDIFKARQNLSKTLRDHFTD